MGTARIDQESLISRPSEAGLIYLTSREYVQVEDQVVLNCALSVQTLRHILDTCKPHVYVNHHLAVTRTQTFELPSQLSLNIYLSQSTLQQIVELQSISAFEHFPLQSERKLVRLLPSTQAASIGLESVDLRTSESAEVELFDKEQPLSDWQQRPDSVRVQIDHRRTATTEAPIPFEQESRFEAEQRPEASGQLTWEASQAPLNQTEIVFESSTHISESATQSTKAKIDLDSRNSIEVQQNQVLLPSEEFEVQLTRRRSARSTLESNELRFNYNQIQSELEFEQQLAPEITPAKHQLKEQQVPEQPLNALQIEKNELIDQTELFDHSPITTVAKQQQIEQLNLSLIAQQADTFEYERKWSPVVQDEANAELTLDHEWNTAEGHVQPIAYESPINFEHKLRPQEARRRSIEVKRKTAETEQPICLEKEDFFSSPTETEKSADRRVETGNEQLTQQLLQQVLSSEQRFRETFDKGNRFRSVCRIQGIPSLSL